MTSAVIGRNKVSLLNCFDAALTEGSELLGTFEKCQGYSTVVASVTTANQSNLGMLQIEMSQDGSTTTHVHRILVTEAHLGRTLACTCLAANYFRVRFTAIDINDARATPVANSYSALVITTSMFSFATAADFDVDICHQIVRVSGAETFTTTSVFPSRRIVGNNVDLFALSDFPLPSTNTTIHVQNVSGNNNDVAGTGARTFRVHGLNENFEDEIWTADFVSSSLDTYGNGMGVSATSPAIFVRVNKIEVLTFGSSGTFDPASTISVRMDISGSFYTILCLSNTSNFRGDTCFFTVPAGHACTPLQWGVTAETAANSATYLGLVKKGQRFAQNICTNVNNLSRQIRLSEESSTPLFQTVGVPGDSFVVEAFATDSPGYAMSTDMLLALRSDAATSANQMTDDGVPVSGYVLYLDALDPYDTGVPPNDHTALTIWRDRSGFGHHVTQPTLAQQPVYLTTGNGSRPCVSFNSFAKQFMTFTGSNSVPLNFTANMTIFVVAKKGAYESSFFAGSDSGFPNIGTGSSSNLRWSNNSTEDNDLQSGASDDNMHILCIKRDNAGSVSGYYDGSDSFSTAADGDITSITFATLGATTSATGYYYGQMCAVLVYPSLLNDTDRQNVDLYLRSRFIDQTFLPVTNYSLYLSAIDPWGNGAALTDSTPLSIWYDKSGHGHHAEQPSSGAQPVFRLIGGEPSVNFIAANETCMEFPGLELGPYFTAFLVTGKHTINTDSGAYILSGDQTSGFPAFTSLVDDKDLAWSGDGSETEVFSEDDVTGVHVITLMRDDDAGVLRGYFSGVEAFDTTSSAMLNGTASFTSLGFNSIDNDKYFNGRLFAVVVYNRLLGTSEREQVETFLTNAFIPDTNVTPSVSNIDATFEDVAPGDTVAITPAIVIEDEDNYNTYVRFTLSDASAGVLTSGGGTVTSVGGGVYEVNGPIDIVNATLAQLEFTVDNSVMNDVTINVDVREDPTDPPLGSGIITITILIPFSASNRDASEQYPLNTTTSLTDIVVAHNDPNTLITATLTLSDPLVGALTTPSGSSYTDVTGTWEGTGNIAAINAQLAAVAFVPAKNFAGSFTIGVSISDGIESPLVGSKSVEPILPLDNTSGSVLAFSMLKLRTAYGGSCLKVRRSSDNTEQTIGFTNNKLDTSTLLSFCGGGDGYVATWYDQSTNGNNANMSVQAQQPRIVKAGALVMASEEEFVCWDTMDRERWLEVADANSLDLNSNLHLMCVATTTKTGVQSTLVDKRSTSGTQPGYALFADTNLKSLSFAWNGASSQGVASGSSNRVGEELFLYNVTATYQSSATMTVNNLISEAKGITSASGSSVNTAALMIGGSNFGPAFRANGLFTSIVLIPDTQYSTALQNTFATYYSVSALTATNMSRGEHYFTNTSKDLSNIVVSDITGGNTTITVQLTIQNTSGVTSTAFGSLSTTAAGSPLVTPTFSSGVWQATGSRTSVNACLAILNFVPVTNGINPFYIATRITDSNGTVIRGSKIFYNFSGALVFLDATNPLTSGTASDGQSITTWADKSGNGRNFIGSAVGTPVRPVYSIAGFGLDKPSILFTGSNCRLVRTSQISLTTTNTIFCFFKMPLGEDSFVMGSSTNSGGKYQIVRFQNLTGNNGSTTGLVMQYNGNTNGIVSGVWWPHGPTENPIMLCMRQSGTSITLRINGVATTVSPLGRPSANNEAPTFGGIGCVGDGNGTSLNADVGVICSFAGSLPDSECARIEAYMSSVFR